MLSVFETCFPAARSYYRVSSKASEFIKCAAAFKRSKVVRERKLVKQTRRPKMLNSAVYLQEVCTSGSNALAPSSGVTRNLKYSPATLS